MSTSQIMPNKEVILNELRNHLKTKYKLANKEIRQYLREEAVKFMPSELVQKTVQPTAVNVPVSIFNDALSPLETMVKYLKELKTMKFVDIAKIFC